MFLNRMFQQSGKEYVPSIIVLVVLVNTWCFVLYVLGPFDLYHGAVEELSERNVVRAICQIEQKLLLEDNSPSIHDSVVAKNPIEQTNVIVLYQFLNQDDNFDKVISSYAEMKVLRTDLQRKGLLHHLVKVKDMIAVKESLDENDQSDLNDGDNLS